ncbi:dehydrogenase E1 component subunit alpha/beta [soil metagenome]
MEPHLDDPDQNVSHASARLSAPAPSDDYVALYRALKLPRTVEDKMLRLIRQSRISKWFSGYGQEGIAVGTAWALNYDDVILPLHRNLGVWTTREVPLRPLFCQLMGRAGGYTNGRDRTFHFGLPERNIIGMISHLGAMLPVACGVALASQLRGSNRIACVFTGEGATREGDFHEALSLAGIWKLPVVFLVENNGYGLSTATAEAVPITDISDAASGYGIAGEQVNGNDVLAVAGAVRRAAARARRGLGPTLLEAKTFRMRGHEEASGTKYVPLHLFEQWRAKDPIALFVQRAEREGWLTAEHRAEIDAELSREVEEAAEWALTQPEVTGTAEGERAAVFAVAETADNSSPAQDPIPSREIRFLDAIREGLDEVLAADESVILMGQDIAEYGGVFKATDGLVEKFGSTRVRNTPIIESGIIGCALGLALEGFKPVVEMQYADFIACGFNQIVNNLATTHYRWGAPVNVTIRAPFGGGIGAGPFHSQSPEAWFCHTPGLKVVVPATPVDAKGLLHASVADPNPVLFFEHKHLYRSMRGVVPEGAYSIHLGEANVARIGGDLTIVTYGVGVRWALDEAEKWASRDVEIEVVDLRTLIPWDRATVLRSVARSNRVIVLHEAQRTAGFGAEVAAQIAEEAFQFLEAPPVRVASEDTPIPFSKQLEQEVYSARAKLSAAIERTLEY